MTSTDVPVLHPQRGQVGYLELPAVDLAGSAAFYSAVFGWGSTPATAASPRPG